MTISFSGLASGLDTSSWITSLTQLRQAKVTKLEEQKSTIATAQTTLQGIRSFFASFRSSIEKITDSKFKVSNMDIFSKKIAEVSNAAVLSATAKSNAAEGSYEVKVNNTATQTQVKSGYRYKTTLVSTTQATTSSSLKNVGIGYGTNPESGITAGNIEITHNDVTSTISISADETMNSFLDKLHAVGIEAEFDNSTGVFSIGVNASDINDIGNTNILSKLKISDINYGYSCEQLKIEESGEIYHQATNDTLLSDLGVSAGTITVTTANGLYEVTLDNEDTIGSLVNTLRSEGIEATFNEGIFSINNAYISDDGETGLIDAFGITSPEIASQTQQSGGLTYQTVYASTTTAQLDSFLKDIDGVTLESDQTIKVKDAEGNTSTITVGTSTTIDNMVEMMNDAGLTVSYNESTGVLSIEDGWIVSGGTFDVESAFGLTYTGVPATVTGSALTTTTTTISGATGDTRLGDLTTAVTSGTIKVTDTTSVVHDLVIDSNDTISDLVSDIRALGLGANFDNLTGVLTLVGGSYTTEGVAEGSASNVLSVFFGQNTLTPSAIDSATSTSQSLRENIITTHAAEGTTTLNQLGMGEGTYTATFTTGITEAEIEISGNMTMSGLVSALRTAGIDASFDAETSKLILTDAEFVGVTGGNFDTIMNFTETITGRYVTSDSVTSNAVTVGNEMTSAGIVYQTIYTTTTVSTTVTTTTPMVTTSGVITYQTVTTTQTGVTQGTTIESLPITYEVNNTVSAQQISAPLVYQSVSVTPSTTTTVGATVTGEILTNITTGAEQTSTLTYVAPPSTVTVGQTVTSPTIFTLDGTSTASASMTMAELGMVGSSGVIVTESGTFTVHATDTLQDVTDKINFGMVGWANNVVANAGTIDGMSLADVAAANNGFISEVVTVAAETTVTNAASLASAISNYTTIGIGSGEALQQLAILVNSGTSCEGKTIVLTADLNLSTICAANTDGEGVGGWTAIGTESNRFQGTFDGNGHVIAGLYIKRPGEDNQGLFGNATGCELRNVGLEHVYVRGYDNVGALAAVAGDVSNCYVAGNVYGHSTAGGLVGSVENITDCYSEAEVRCNYNASGLAVNTHNVTNCYSTGDVYGNSYISGLVGSVAESYTIRNSYATGNVTASNGEEEDYGYHAAGLAVNAYDIQDSYATGDVTASYRFASGLVNEARGNITGCYATGDVTAGDNFAGGLVCKLINTSPDVTITCSNSFAYGNVYSTEGAVGSLVCGVIDRSGPNIGIVNFSNTAAYTDGNMIYFEGYSEIDPAATGQAGGWLENIDTLNYAQYQDGQLTITPHGDHYIKSMTSNIELVLGMNSGYGETYDINTLPGATVAATGTTTLTELGLSQDGTIVNNAGNMVTIRTTDTINSVVSKISLLGITASFTDGMLTVGNSTDNNYITNISAGVSLVLGIDAGANSSYSVQNGVTATESMTMAQLGMQGDSGVIVTDSGTITVLATDTLGSVMNKIEGFEMPDWAQEVKANAGLTSSLSPTHNGFIDEVVCDTPDIIVEDPDQLATAISSNTIIGIGNARTLAKLAQLVNDGTTCEGKTIILTDDVDLASICAANTDGEGNGGWTPIGNSSNQFNGAFHGNGHKVTGLYIKRTGTDYQGLFGYTTREIKNIGVEGANVTGGDYTGGLAGYAQSTITNSYATGNVSGSNYTGGLVGNAEQEGNAKYNISNCYATGNVSGEDYTGGLAGAIEGAIIDSYSTGNVTGNDYIGGLAGYAQSSITNSYATGNVTGNDYIGGLAGYAQSTITNSYATGSVSGGGNTGGLAGYAYSAITNSYATGSVTGQGQYTGGLAGYANNKITNSYATGNVSGSNYTGGLAGYANNTITNICATGNVTGTEWVGGLVGQLSKTSGTLTYNQILSARKVSGESKVGSLIGGIVNTTNGTSFSTITITNASARSQGDMIGFEGNVDGTAYESGQMDGWLASIDTLDSLMQTSLVNGQLTITPEEGHYIKSMSSNLEVILGINSGYGETYEVNIEEQTTETMSVTATTETTMAQLGMSGASGLIVTDSGTITVLATDTIDNVMHKMRSNNIKEESYTTSGTAGTIGGLTLEECAAANGGFIAEVVTVAAETTVTDAASLASAISTYTTIGIGSAEALAQLATLVNSGTNCSGKTIVLTADLDLSSICAANTDGEGVGGWTAIGDTTDHYFNGNFNGNGHTISGLYINQTDTTNKTGLFGYVGNDITIENVGIVDANISSDSTAGVLVGNVGDNHFAGTATTIQNCYTSGNIDAGAYSGGLIGTNMQVTLYLTNCYSECDVSGNIAGGLVGRLNRNGHFVNCYSSGDVTGDTYASGLANSSPAIITNITNSYTTGDITVTNDVEARVSGLCSGSGTTNITDSFAAGYAMYGAEAQFSSAFENGQITITPEEGHYIQSITPNLAAILGINAGEGYSYNSSPSTEYAKSETVLTTLGMAPDTTGLIRTDSGTITISSSSTIDEVICALDNAGFQVTFNDSVLEIVPEENHYIQSITSNLAGALNLEAGYGISYEIIDEITETTSVTATEDTTFAELGMTGYGTIVLCDQQGQNIYYTIRDDQTLSDFVNTLNPNIEKINISTVYKETGILELGNREDNFYVKAMSANLVAALGNISIGENFSYEINTQIEESEVVTTSLASVTLSNTFGDIGISSESVLNLSNGETVTVNSSTTFTNFIDDMANKDMTVSLVNGIFNIAGGETYVTSITGQNVLNAMNIVGSTYHATDLSLGNTKLADLKDSLGNSLNITSGAITAYKNGIANNIYIDNNSTLDELASQLSNYNIQMVYGSGNNGRIYFTSNGDSYLSAIPEGTNLLSALNIETWTAVKDTKSNALAYNTGNDVVINGATKLVDLKNTGGESMGITAGKYKIVADGINYEGTITASTSVNDLFTELARYGITGSINSDGQITLNTANDDTYLVKANGAAGYSTLVDNLFSSWTFGNIYVSDGMDVTTTNTQMINRDTKMMDIDGLPPLSTLLKVKNTQTNEVVAQFVVMINGTTVGHFMDELSMYGFTSYVNSSGQLVIQNNGYNTLVYSRGSIDVIEEFGLDTSAWEQPGYYTGSAQTATTYSTVLEAATLSTTLANLKDAEGNNLGITTGEYYVYSNGVKHTLNLNSTDITLNSFINTLAGYGINAIFDTAGGQSVLKIVGNGDSYVASSEGVGASNVVEKLFGNSAPSTLYDYEGYLQTTELVTTTVIASLATMLSDYDNGETKSEGIFAFSVDGTYSEINITSYDTFGSLIEKFERAGVQASLNNGVLRLETGNKTFVVDNEHTTSNLLSNLGLNFSDNLGGFAASNDAVTQTTTTIEDRTLSVAKYADYDTQLSLLNISSGTLSVYRNGAKKLINIDNTETFSQLRSRLQDAFADINIDFDNGILRFFSTTEGVDVQVGASNDTSNISSICGFSQDENGYIVSARELYKVNASSLITTAGLFRYGDVTEGTFIVGDETFNITNTTTIQNIVAQINSSDKANASAYWDSVDGKLVISSRSTGASMVNIEAGTSNFTDILGLTTSEWNPDGSVSITKIRLDSQEIGENARFSINGTNFQSASNVITSDVSRIQGLTLNLKSSSMGDTVTVTVGKDTAAVSEAVGEFVEAYNELVENVDAELSAGGALKDQSTLKAIRQQIRNLLVNTFAGATTFRNLAALGISTSAGNSITAGDVSNAGIEYLYFDAEKFLDGYNKDSEAVKNMLVGSDETPGILLQIENIVENALATGSGYFSSADKSYSDKITSINEKIRKANQAIEAYRARLESKFQSMDLLISQMQNQYNSFLSV